MTPSMIVSIISGTLALVILPLLRYVWKKQDERIKSLEDIDKLLVKDETCKERYSNLEKTIDESKKKIEISEGKMDELMKLTIKQDSDISFIKDWVQGIINRRKN